jgi:hypothetical protein
VPLQKIAFRLCQTERRHPRQIIEILLDLNFDAGIFI